MAVDFGNPYRVLNDVWDQASRALRITGSLSIDTANIASSDNQTNGSQKTQIVDAGGEAVTVTGGKLDVNASVDTTGLATSTKQDTIIGHLDGVETLLSSIDTKTPALGQALAAASVPVVLTAAQLTTLTPPAAITGYATSAKQDTIIGHLDGVEGLLGTIDADTGSILTSVELIDDTVFVDDADFSDGVSKGLGIMGVAENTPTTVTDGDMGMIGIDPSTRAVKIHDGGNSITVDGTVTVTATNLDVQSGGADLATSTQGASIVTAVELIDDAVYVDDADWTADTSKHVLVGGVTQVATTANADGDVTPLTTNAFRELRTAIPESDLATAGTAHVKKYYTNAGAVTDGIIWSPAAGKRWYVTDLIINVSAAATVTLEDDKAGGDEAVMKFELAANSGISHSFQTPWFSGEDAADLIITTSAGNVYVTVTGYEV